jgi:hypothetical protein
MTQEQQQVGAPAADSMRKDQYFERLALVSEEMIRDFGRDFAMGALVLAARYIAERQGAKPAGQAVSQTP